MITGKLVFEDGSVFQGKSFGAEKSSVGEIVFSTGMVGYPESLTDPSYLGQILILTYPLIGNYGIPDKKYWESDSLKISGLIVSNYIDTPSHFLSKMTLSIWLKKEGIPALEIPDTRFLTQKIRTKGAMLGKIVFDKDVDFYNPNKENLIAKVSLKKTQIEGKGKKTIVLIDCGATENIKRCLIKRGVRVITVPWNFDPFEKIHLRGVASQHLGGGRLVLSELVLSEIEGVEGMDSSEVDINSFDAIIISSGPGDPKMAVETIKTVQKALERKIPVLGICLGHQILALAAGGDTYKLKFGHRSQNQPCILQKSLIAKKCFITTQNHGFAVKNIPLNFNSWFVNANDQTNEGIIHRNLPFMSVQFHPEANPGPTDTEWIFDFFLKRIKL